MWFLVLGLLFMALKYLEVGFIAGVTWWWVLAPLGVAFVYWELVDPFFGISKKRAVRQMDERKQARINKQREALYPHLRKGKRP
jgi:small Trp-rich protein